MAFFFERYAMYIFVLAALLVGIPAVWIHRDRAGVKLPGVIILCVLYAAGSLVSALFFARLENYLSGGDGGFPGAISTYGIYFFGPLIMLLAAKLFRLKPAGVLDIYALCVVIGCSLLRVNCLRAGCCTGLPFFQTEWYWPTREMELVFYLVMFVVLWRLLWKNNMPGQLFPLIMAGYGVFRFINQWFRDDEVSGLHMSHGWSVLCALIGFSLLFEMRAQSAKKKKSVKRK